MSPPPTLVPPACIMNQPPGAAVSCPRWHSSASRQTPEGPIPTNLHAPLSDGPFLSLAAHSLSKPGTPFYGCPRPARRRNAAAFTAGWEEGVSPEQQAAEAAAAGPLPPSPAMLLAADSLQQLLRALAQHLDAVVFRWVLQLGGRWSWERACGHWQARRGGSRALGRPADGATCYAACALRACPAGTCGKAWPWRSTTRFTTRWPPRRSSRPG